MVEIDCYANSLIEEGKYHYNFGEERGNGDYKRIGLNIITRGLIQQNPPREVERADLYSKSQVESHSNP